jgi:hypothetical protein
MFDKRPINQVAETVRLTEDDAGIRSSYEAMVTQIVERVETSSKEIVLVALDGTHGAAFHPIVQKTVEHLEKKGMQVDVLSSYSFLKSGQQLRSYFKHNITGNRAFGYVTDRSMEDFFRAQVKEEFEECLQAFVEDESRAAKRAVLVFGPGAYWLGQSNFELSLFLDVSREYQQVHHRKQLLNFGMSWNRDPVEKYKIAYFVEWPFSRLTVR